VGVEVRDRHTKSKPGTTDTQPGYPQGLVDSRRKSFENLSGTFFTQVLMSSPEAGSGGRRPCPPSLPKPKDRDRPPTARGIDTLDRRGTPTQTPASRQWAASGGFVTVASDLLDHRRGEHSSQRAGARPRRPRIRYSCPPPKPRDRNHPPRQGVSARSTDAAPLSAAKAPPTTSGRPAAR
jgi:hypothetical protein